jgi:hypothetical protein
VGGGLGNSDRWRRQLNTWAAVVRRFGLDPSRYAEFSYLCFLPLNNDFIYNYVQFQLGKEDPIIFGRIRAHATFWESLNAPDWLMDVIKTGVKIPFSSQPPRIILPNNKSAVESGMVAWVRTTLKEYLAFGFVQEVSEIPYCVSPLQVKNTGGKLALIYDMSLLNSYVEKGKFKLEGWEEMFEFSRCAAFGIKFDLKKFYHEIDIHNDYQKYFGFMFPMEEGRDSTYFIWKTMDVPGLRLLLGNS